eukprot:TRINITY_DN3121_c4_g8_i1.p1 TRINITY_DN3121_c4_g8~~TRINITY_DN3121_c4_g8_i1.p1  ORF type:complete len:227 (+),score=81.03 TRINITY_DN3121_c4_g8_i1:44-682(+)
MVNSKNVSNKKTKTKNTSPIKGVVQTKTVTPIQPKSQRKPAKQIAPAPKTATKQSNQSKKIVKERTHNVELEFLGVPKETSIDQLRQIISNYSAVLKLEPQGESRIVATFPNERSADLVLECCKNLIIGVSPVTVRKFSGKISVRIYNIPDQMTGGEFKNIVFENFRIQGSCKIESLGVASFDCKNISQAKRLINLLNQTQIGEREIRAILY